MKKTLKFSEELFFKKIPIGQNGSEKDNLSLCDKMTDFSVNLAMSKIAEVSVILAFDGILDKEAMKKLKDLITK